MITDVYISMNGIFTDFDSYYATCAPNWEDQRTRFSEVITHVRIYDKLVMIDGSYELIRYFKDLPINVQILTSTETAVPKLVMETQQQRIRWLMKHGVPFKPVFTFDQFQKSKYATPTSLLITANTNAAAAFSSKGGKVIFYKDVETTKAEFIELVKSA
jgi:hypothetical protein